MTLPNTISLRMQGNGLVEYVFTHAM
jgi:hypothetical protein